MARWRFEREAAAAAAAPPPSARIEEPHLNCICCRWPTAHRRLSAPEEKAAAATLKGPRDGCYLECTRCGTPRLWGHHGP